MKVELTMVLELLAGDIWRSRLLKARWDTGSRPRRRRFMVAIGKSTNRAELSSRQALAEVTG